MKTQEIDKLLIARDYEHLYLKALDICRSCFGFPLEREIYFHFDILEMTKFREITDYNMRVRTFQTLNNLKKKISDEPRE